MPVQVSVVPGFSAASYSISAPLPAGLSFSTSTGMITGSATTLTPTTTYVITANLVTGGTSTCNFIITVTNEPPTALASNTASAVAKTNFKLLEQQNWLASVEQIISNNSTLGIYWAFADLTSAISFNWAYTYLTSLSYSVQNLSPSQNDFQFVSAFGQFPSFTGNEAGFYDNYNDFTQPFPLVTSKPPRRIRISWTPFNNGYPVFPPFTPFPTP